MLPRFFRPLFACVVCASAVCSGVRWNDLRLQAQADARLGRFQQAEALLNAALASADEKGAAGVAIWNDLGSVHHSQGLLLKAEQNFEHVLALNAQLPKPDLIQSAIALNNLATLAGEQHDATKAERLLRQAYVLLQAANQTRDDTAALIHTNLALTLAQQGRYAEAAMLYRQAAPEVKERFGAQTLEYARLLTGQGLLQLHMGSYREAVASGREALAIERILPYVSPYERALTLNNLGLALSKSGEIGEAKRVLNEAVHLWEGTPEGREELISSLNNLGSLEEKQRNLEAARRLEQRALQLLEPGPNGDLLRAAVWTNLGRIAFAERNFGEARELFAKASKIGESQTGIAQVRYAATLSNLAALESAEKHYKRAEALYRKSLAIDEARLGPEHPEVASDLSNIAVQMVYQKRYPEALELYTRARTIAEKSFGPVNSPLAHIWRNMAVAYYTSKQFRESAFAYKKALETSPDPNVSLWLHEYALALRKLERFGEAEAAETRAIGIDVRNTLAAQKRRDNSGTL